MPWYFPPTDSRGQDRTRNVRKPSDQLSSRKFSFIRVSYCQLRELTGDVWGIDIEIASFAEGVELQPWGPEVGSAAKFFS
jgi:hypothetical protein